METGKKFLTNDENKKQLIQVVLDVWSSPDFATYLATRTVIMVAEGHAYQLQAVDDNTIQRK